jgi:hypothetical protein
MFHVINTACDRKTLRNKANVTDRDVNICKEIFEKEECTYDFDGKARRKEPARKT